MELLYLKTILNLDHFRGKSDLCGNCGYTLKVEIFK